MRIHLAALAAASLFVLAVPRPPSGQALVQGIPLGDLVRPKPTQQPVVTPRPEVPTERNPAISQFSAPASTSTGSTPSMTPSSTQPPSTLGTPPPPSATGSEPTLGTQSNTVTGTSNPGLNLNSPGLPQTPASSNTVGGTAAPNGTLSPGSTGSTVGGVGTTGTPSTNTP